MHITVKVMATDSAVAALSVCIAVTLMFTSLSRHCHYHCCHKAVLVFAFGTSVSDRCVSDLQCSPIVIVKRKVLYMAFFRSVIVGKARLDMNLVGL